MSSNQSDSTANTNRIETNNDASSEKQTNSLLRQHVLLLLIGLRLFNALTLRTFFQPDEYYQALEPAWWFAFGDGAGAWITWVRCLRTQIMQANDVIGMEAPFTFSTSSCLVRLRVSKYRLVLKNRWYIIHRKCSHSACCTKDRISCCCCFG